MKEEWKQRLIYIVIFSLILVIAIPFILGGKPTAYQLTDVEEANDSIMSINVNEEVTIHCRAYQPWSGTEVTEGATCNHYMQWNDSTTSWTDVPTSSNTVWVSTNPHQWQIGKIGVDTWHDLQAYNVNFTVVGTYNIRCREPSETCSNSVVLTSDSYLIVEVAEPAVDTCSPSTPLSADYVYECSDDCVISSNVDAGGYDILINGTGTLTMNADITNFGTVTVKGTDSTNRCKVTCQGGCFKD